MTFSATLLVSGLLTPLALMAADWPQWRGPAGNGSSPETGLPESCDPASAKWSVELPGAGHATPIIANARIFIRTAGKLTCLAK